MADFELAVAKTIANEGGHKYTETESDNGEATKYGISLKLLLLLHDKHIFLSGIPGRATVLDLTLEQAKYIYKSYFWDENRYGEINDQAIAEKVFDMAVLMGASQANKIFQIFIKRTYEPMCGIEIDGIIGDKTIYWCNDGNTKCILQRYIEVFNSKLCEHFISICNKDKTQSKFLLGWLNRVMS